LTNFDFDVRSENFDKNREIKKFNLSPGGVGDGRVKGRESEEGVKGRERVN